MGTRENRTGTQYVGLPRVAKMQSMLQVRFPGKFNSFPQRDIPVNLYHFIQTLTTLPKYTEQSGSFT